MSVTSRVVDMSVLLNGPSGSSSVPVVVQASRLVISSIDCREQARHLHHKVTAIGDDLRVRPTPEGWKHLRFRCLVASRDAVTYSIPEMHTSRSTTESPSAVRQADSRSPRATPAPTCGL